MSGSLLSRFGIAVDDIGLGLGNVTGTATASCNDGTRPIAIDCGGTIGSGVSGTTGRCAIGGFGKYGGNFVDGTNAGAAATAGGIDCGGFGSAGFESAARSVRHGTAA